MTWAITGIGCAILTNPAAAQMVFYGDVMIMIVIEGNIGD